VRTARPGVVIQPLGPAARPTSLPSRPTRTTVGVPLTWYATVTLWSKSRSTGTLSPFSLTQGATRSRRSWIFTARMARPRSLNVLWTSSIVEGNSLAQSGHHVAQK